MKNFAELNWRERMACRIMGKLKYNEDDKIYQCLHNDVIMTVVKLLLGGLDEIKLATCFMAIEEGNA